jgi:DNA-binding response OmpR family regulator
VANGQRILLVDDEEAIIATLAPFLERAGFIVSTARDGREALTAILNSEPNLVILDVLMPRLDGREVLRRLREKDNWIPVILLTQVSAPAERVMALNEGADDYISKPFDPHELIARITAVLRRVRQDRQPLTAAQVLTCGELRLDRRTGRVWLGQQTLELTPKASELLLYLMTHPDELLGRDRLLDVLWGFESPLTTRAVDARVAELRSALGDERGEPRFIETVHGVGYRFIGKVEVSE